MSDHTKKHETAHAPPGSMKDSQSRIPADAINTHNETAAADKRKRESGKDKERHKR